MKLTGLPSNYIETKEVKIIRNNDEVQYYD